MEQIACKECTSPYCHGCNMYRLEQMLKSGKLDALMDENRTIKMDADVRPVKRGRNIYYERRGTDCDFMCSECGAWVGSVMWGTLDGGNFKFCPNCGAEMREES